jgi:tyrosine-protein phosphatase YwqE
VIDIHNHILPGVDDGAQTIDDAIAIARAAVKEGITTIITTPIIKTEDMAIRNNSLLHEPLN